MLNPSDNGSAEALFKASNPGDSGGNLPNQNLISKVDEEPVLENAGNVVDRLLKSSGITDATVKLEVEHEVALIRHDRAGFALSHPQLRQTSELLKFLLDLSPGPGQHLNREQKTEVETVNELG